MNLIEQKRKKLYNFMDWKDKYLSKHKLLKRHEYFNYSDKEKISNLTITKVNLIYKAIIGLLDNMRIYDDTYICPFCIVCSTNCSTCTYHDKCDEYGSTWKKFIGHIYESIGEKKVLNYIKIYFTI